MLLVLLLVVAGLAGAMMPQQAAGQENYYIGIGGKWITSDNYTDISASGGFEDVQSGTVTFDPATYTLTLNNATIDTYHYIGIYNPSGKTLHIVLVGNNTIKSVIDGAIRSRDGELSITGSGTLTVESAYSAAISTFYGSLQIEGCTINTTREIYVGKGDLIIKNATVKAETSISELSAFMVSGEIRLEGCGVTSPSGTSIGTF